jgi:hypoxanthine-DNA glycosylase
MEAYQHVLHGFEPVYSRESRILILGSFPSVRSRSEHFFYGNPRNRFWEVLAKITEAESTPACIDEKRRFLLANRIAIWDVIAECDIIGSSDSSIRNVIPTDLSRILCAADIRAVYANGRKAGELFHRFQEKETGRSCVVLPSTSPANAAWSLEKLTKKWDIIRENL